MWLDKLAEGVLQIDTQIGPRFVQLTFKQRVYLLWMFRHFGSLPHQVLSLREQRFVQRLCDESGFVSMPLTGAVGAPVIGRIENRVPLTSEIVPLRKPAVGEKAPGREQGREAASA